MAICKARREASGETKAAYHDLGLPASRDMRKYISVIEATSLWYLVRVTQLTHRVGMNEIIWWEFLGQSKVVLEMGLEG